jgi:hypothetical protein
MSLLRQIAELNRQSAANDRKFLRSLLYYFELRVPWYVGQNPGPFLYPLILAPESLRMTEPFTVDRAFTNGGGLFVEEQGIIARELTISGHTGFQPTRSPRPISDFSQLTSPSSRSYSRNNTTAVGTLLALSGQRHFQYLQDAVFRTYGDLKRDPNTSEGTALYFHVPKDDEHWRVIPLNFVLERDAGKPLLYRYQITMLAVQDADRQNVTFSEDRGVLNTLKDKFRCLRRGIGLVRAALQDLAAVQGELRAFNGGFVGLLDGAVGLADAAGAFVEGTATLIAQPFNLVENTIRSGLDALLEFNTGIEQTTAVGPSANLLNSIRQIIDGVALIGSYPTSFRNGVQAAVDRYNARNSLATSRRSDALLAAANSGPPQTARDFARWGSALLPGDYVRASTDLGLASATPRYQSAFSHTVEQGDTLENLAARFLEDARNWKFIALFNDLRPPFISAEGLPGTVTVGGSILIPSLQPPPDVVATPATLGVRSEDPAPKHALGSDLAMVPVGRALYDLDLNMETGPTDFRVVTGVANLRQGVRTRIITERGTDLLYRDLGCSRLVGLGVNEVDLETAQFRLVDALLADSRLASIRSFRFDQDAPDSVVAEITAEVRGFSRPERIRVAA